MIVIGKIHRLGSSALGAHPESWWWAIAVWVTKARGMESGPSQAETSDVARMSGRPKDLLNHSTLCLPNTTSCQKEGGSEALGI